MSEHAPAPLPAALAVLLYMRSSIWKSVGKKMSAVPGGTRYLEWSLARPASYKHRILCEAFDTAQVLFLWCHMVSILCSSCRGGQSQFECLTVEATRGAFFPGMLVSGSSSKSAAKRQWLGLTLQSVSSRLRHLVGRKMACSAPTDPSANSSAWRIALKETFQGSTLTCWPGQGSLTLCNLFQSVSGDL